MPPQEVTEGDRPLRVAYAAPGLVLRPGGGPCEHFLSVCRALARLPDIELAVVMGAPGPDVDVERAGLPEGARFLPLQRPSDAWTVTDSLALGAHPSRYLHHRRSVRAIARQLGEWQVDAVIERMWGFGGILGGAAKRAGATLVLEENGPPGFEGRPLRWTDALRTLYLWGSRLRSRFVYRSAHRIIVQTEPLKEILSTRYGAPKSRIAVVPNAVDPHLLTGDRDQSAIAEARHGCGLPIDAKVVVYCGSLDRSHNVLPVAEALLALPEERRVGIHLVVLGNGFDKEALEALALGAGRGVLHVLCAQPRPILHRYLQAADLALAPYDPRAFDKGKFFFSSLKIREYLAAELPVAATAGTVDALVEHGHNGFQISEPAGWQALFAALPDRERLYRMGQGSRARVSSYTYDDVAVRYRELIRAARGSGSPA